MGVVRFLRSHSPLVGGHSHRDARHGSVRIGRGVKLGSAILRGRNSIGDHSELSGDITIGYASTLGTGCILRGSVTVGNYCQFGPRVSLFSRNHPFDYVTTYVNMALLDGLMKSLQVQVPIAVENDVWIGCGAVVTKGVTVRNGAVVGANSVVTDDVPEYAIVAGNPARIIRKRFDDRIIELLLELRWWDLTVEQLGDLRELFTVNMVQEQDRALDLLHGLKERMMRRTGEPT